MTNQRTLLRSFSLEGRGLLTGIYSHITFKPASENYGYKIRRTDLPEMPTIDAVAENVTETQKGTTISNGNVSVATIEHALAALYACGIDNCHIDIDGPEFPILDGTSVLYVNKIEETGFEEQNYPRKYICFGHKRIKVIDETSGSSIVLLPDESFSVYAHICFDSVVLKHQYAFMSEISEFTSGFAPARMFQFARDIAPLLTEGLIKEWHINETIIIYDRIMDNETFDLLTYFMGIPRKDPRKLGYIMNRKLQFVNEPSRHKVLDIVGDIALSGGFLKGRIIANCPNHTINTIFARTIRKTHEYNQKTKTNPLSSFNFKPLFKSK